MSAAPPALEETAEAFQESLTERMSRGALPVAEALRYAIQVATCLRDLHTQGLVYGAVSSQLILLTPAGAALRTGGSLAQLGDPRHDVAAFGDLLGEMLRNIEGSEILQIELGRLAILCQMDAPDMQQVLITLRLLAVQARQRAVVVVPPPEPRAKAEEKQSSFSLRMQAALHWKPIAGLAALALWAK
jgi:hypothetical protein